MKILILLFIFLSATAALFAQEKKAATKDTFFLAKKKGILGRIGRTLHRNDEPVKPRLTVEEFRPFYGKIIRHIIIKPVGFSQKLGDTTAPKKGKLFNRVANGLHLNSTEELISKNLFFKEGQPFYPLYAADNERFLRTLEYLRDAIIKVSPVDGEPEYVDVIVFTRDIFSIGGSLSANANPKVDLEVVEENFGGSGNRLTLATLYDKDRSPGNGYGAEYMLRNINGSFINWANGFNTFNKTFNSGRQEEIMVYSKVEKPMASRYTAITGALELAYHSTHNGYLSDSLYTSDFKYSYLDLDLWTGYNFGKNRAKERNETNPLRHFVGFRTFFSQFFKVPDKYQGNYYYKYADINGVLLSYNIYRQSFYRANFIYGFGINEDIPNGIKAGLIGGFINKQGVRRAYYGTEAEWSYFDKKGCLFSYTLKAGGFASRNNIEDIDFLMNIDHFSKLRTMGSQWYNRYYFSIGYTRQVNRNLNEPLFMNSDFGLPYYKRGLLEGKMRAAIKAESIFYNMHRFLGFRFAPFIFANLGVMQAVGDPYRKTNGYPVFGGGVRSRNENLAFGTMELRGYYIPRPFDGMKTWKVELGTNLRFRYNSNFIRKPDFVSPN
ncbi:MAG: hypothetical protein QM687_12705 [Ferruginibacter sp.]